MVAALSQWYALTDRGAWSFMHSDAWISMKKSVCHRCLSVCMSVHWSALTDHVLGLKAHCRRTGVGESRHLSRHLSLVDILTRCYILFVHLLILEFRLWGIGLGNAMNLIIKLNVFLLVLIG